MNFLGIEIGGTKLQVVAGKGREIIDRRRFAIDPKAGGEGIRRQISSVLPELCANHAPKAIGVGFGGPLNWRTGRIACSNQIEGWSDFPLAEWLTKETGLSVKIENDADIAAWAEFSTGADAGADPLFYMTLGSGIGGGLVAGGAIYHGALPGQAEIGHLRVDRAAPRLEKLCSGWAVDQKIRDARGKHPDSLLFQLIGNESRGESRHLAPAIAKGDVLAQKIIRETGETLALALSHVTHLMHPEVIVIGGGLSLVGEPLRSAVAEALPAFLIPAFQPGPRVALASLGEDVVPIGALLLAESAMRKD
jgi:glucokinase